LIQLARPLTRFAGGGYRLDGVLSPAGLDLPRLLCGSGGTLGLVAAATLKTVPLPGGECRAAVGFPSVEAAVRAGLALSRSDGLTECELLDGRLAAAARGAGIGGVARSVGAVLALAWEAETEAMAWACGVAALDGLRGRHVYRRLADPAADPAGRDRVVAFRAAALANLYAVGPGRRPVPGCDDLAAPLDELTRFLADARSLVQAAGLTASLHVRVAAGVVHLRPLLDLADPADAARLWPLADALHTRALGCGGSVGPTLGAGLARTLWVAAQAGPLAAVYAELKRVFDPANVLNPGQVVGPDPARPAWPLRAGVRAEPEPDSPGRIPLAPACNACGVCRPRTGSGRSCPTFRAGGDETASPRSKPLLVLAGADPADEAVRAAAGLCVHCKMCPRECPAGVDVPGIAVGLKAAYFAAHGLPRGAWLPARVDSLSRFAGVFALSANVALDSAPARWLLEKTVGLARRRRLPRLTHRTFLRRAWAGGLCGDPKPLPGAAKVAYFVDTFANRHDPLVGQATVAVLRRNGFAVRVPWRQKASGLALLVAGDRDAARELAAYNVRTLAPLVRDGYTVVCSEPAAAVALAQEYPALLDTPDARLVAANTVEVMTLLGRRLAAGTLDTAFLEVPLTVGLHVPCHVKALGEPAAARLLAHIPGLEVVPLADGCSGMAGPWGLTAAHTPTSYAAGRVMLDSFAAPAVAVGTAECSSCRLQMQDAAGKRAVHPVLLLAHAYGLLPQIGRRLARPVGARLTDG
jgi:Fe-S oxidoreductase